MLVACILIFIIILYILKCDNISYFGTGPTIFEPDNIYSYYTPVYSLEPVYVKPMVS